MTHRIARAILLSTCLTIIAAGVVTYFALRHVVVSELDQLLMERATLVLRDVGLGSDDPSRRVPESDRYLIRTDSGQTIARPPSLREEPVHPTIVSRGFARTAEDGRIRTLTLRWSPPPPEPSATILYSTPARAYDTALWALATALTTVTLVGMGITGLVARRVARRATLPLRQTADAIGQIDPKHLARRIDTVSLPAELVPVGIRLNEMLARIESAFGRERRFLIDAAHELRTPVAALRTTVEVALASRRDPGALPRALERCLNIARLLERLSVQLTDALRPQRDPRPGDISPVNVGRIVGDCAEAVESLAVARRQTLSVEGTDGPLLEIDADRLRSIVVNLLSNAIDYTPEGGRIEVSAGMVDRTWRLVVRDNGPGIASEHLPRIFDPFFRVDGSRGRNLGHLGLGLYLVRCHADAIGAEVRVESDPGVGTAFHVSLLPPVGPVPGRDDRVGAPDPGTTTPERRSREGVGASCSLQD